MDNLNTHHPASLYAAFSPQEARRITDKSRIHYTPKDESWLTTWLKWDSVSFRRIADQQSLINAVDSWQKERNERKVAVNWRFATEDARIKLKGLYPVLEN
jgi:hypothetical protein